MNNSFAVNVTKVPGGSKHVISDGSKTIEVIFAEAFSGESISGYQIRLDGREVAPTAVVQEGQTVSLAKMVKGNG